MIKRNRRNRNTYSPRMSILTIAKFAPSTLERAFFTFTIVMKKLKREDIGLP